MPHRSANPDIHQLRNRLRVICRRVRAILIGRSVLISISLLVGSLIVLGYLDFLLHLPMGLRVVTLVGLGALSVRCWIKYIHPTIGIELRPSDIALEIERQDPTMRGLLASAVDLDRPKSAQDDDENEIHQALKVAALSSANRRLAGRVYPSILNLRDLGKALCVFVLIGIGIFTMNLRSPDLVAIGLSRTLSPWSNASWPMRYAILDTTPSSARAIDIAVPIRALIGSSHSSESNNAQAKVSWRVLDERNRSVTAWTRTMLVPQHRRDALNNTPIYEQLIDVQSAVAGRDELTFVLEYKIETRDDTIANRRITLVRPPELLETTLDIQLPDYASPIAESELVRSGVIVTDRSDSVVSPILAQSRVKIAWRFSKPIDFSENMTPAWVASLAAGNTILHIDQPEPNIIELELIANSSASIEPGVLDEMGIPVRTPIVLALGVLSDQSPGASITEPERDEVVSTHAVIDLEAELTDDFGLAQGSILVTRARVPAESSGAPHEPIDEGMALAGVEEAETQLRVTLNETLHLGSLEIEPGDQVWIFASAMDLQGSETQSPMRVLRIVDDAALIEQIRNGLGPIRNALRQLDGQQAQLQQMLRDGKLTSSRDQRSVTTRLDANRRTIEQLLESVERNTLDDPALESLLNDASSILDEAIKAGERASDQIDRGESEQAGENQRTVRDRLGELLSMLDRGQDSWLALRAIQQLRDELEALRDDTAELNAQTAGKSIDQLSPEQKSALERILERQLEAADDAGDALSTLDERAEQLEEHDPTQAEALRQAAQQGRSAQIEQKLKEAGEQIESNQTSSATQTQSEVLEELEEMLEELENTIRNRDNALRRELASIIDSLKELIKVQKTEIGRVDASDADNRMIALVGNTLAVRDDALGAFPETRSIADLITKAGNAQNNAINALRGSPIDLKEAERFERSSLLNLNSALEEANRIDDQAADRQAQRLRAELRDAYRENLEIQTAVRDESSLLVGDALNRRQRASARSLAASQEEIRVRLGEMLVDTEELGDAPVFAMAHAQLERLMSKSSDGLSQGTIDRRVIVSQGSAIVILSTLVEVLSDSAPDQDSEDFDDGSSGGGQGESGGGGDEPVIPPIAQLKLLRSMQQLAAMQTREFSENPGMADDADIDALSDLQKQLFEHGRKLIEDMSPNPNPEQVPEVDTDGPIEPQEESQG